MKSVTQPERGRGMMLSVVAAAAALIALLAFAPFASAASDPVASGTTTLTLNKGFYKKLKKNGVKVLKVSPGTVKNRTVTLPVNPTGSSLDPTTGQGTISQSGGIKFKAGKKSAALGSLVIDTAKSSLSGKVGGKKMKVATVAGLSFTRDGFGTDVSIGKLKLTSQAAKQLNKKLGFSGKSSGKSKRASTSSADSAVFKANQVMGSSSSTTQPTTVTLVAQGNAVLIPNAATLGKFFVGKGISPLTGITPIAPATAVTGPAFVFPLSGGTLAPNASAGTVTSSGGIQVKSASATLSFTNLSLDFGTKTVLADITILPAPGAVGNSSIADIDMSAATVTSDATAKTITVTGANVKLQAVAAATLNATFPGGTDFVAGDSLGTVSFTAHTQ